MRSFLLTFFLVTCGQVLPAGVHAVLPGCCSNVSTMVAINPSSGLAQQVFTVPTAEPTGSTPATFAFSLSGNAFYIVAPGDDNTDGQLSRVSLPGGQVTASASFNGRNITVEVSPVTGALFVSTASSSGAGYTIAQLDPNTLATLRSNSDLSLGPQMSFSPGADRIYMGADDLGGFQIIRTSDLHSLGIVAVFGGCLPLPSPDGSTLYVASSTSTSVTAASIVYLNAVTLQTERTVPIASINYVRSSTLSPDGSMLYFGASDGTGINSFVVSFSVSAGTYTSVAVPSSITSIAVAPDNSAVYVSTGSLYQEPGVSVYSPATQTITATYPLMASASLAVSRNGKTLYELLSQTSALAVTGPLPNTNIAVVTSVGLQAGVGAYDEKHGLVLIPGNGSVDIYNGATLRLLKVLDFPQAIGMVVASGSNADYAFGHEYEYQSMVYQFDPLSGSISGSTQLPLGEGEPGEIGGAAVTSTGNLLYLTNSYAQQIEELRISGISGYESYVQVIETSGMQLIHSWLTPFPTLGGIAVQPSGGAGYYVGLSFPGVTLVKFDPATGQGVRTLTLSTTIASSLSNPVLSADGSTLYLGLNGMLESIDTATFTVTGEIPASEANYLTLTRDGSYLYGSSVAGYAIYSTNPLAALGTISSTTLAAPAILVGE